MLEMSLEMSLNASQGYVLQEAQNTDFFWVDREYVEDMPVWGVCVGGGGVGLRDASVWVCEYLGAQVWPPVYGSCWPAFGQQPASYTC